MPVLSIVILLGLALLAIAIIGLGCVLLFWPKVEPAFQEKIAYSDAEQAVLSVARLAIPAFDDAARASDILVEMVQAAVLGQMSPEEAMNTVQERVELLLAE